MGMELMRVVKVRKSNIILSCIAYGVLVWVNGES